MGYGAWATFWNGIDVNKVGIKLGVGLRLLTRALTRSNEIGGSLIVLLWHLCPLRPLSRSVTLTTQDGAIALQELTDYIKKRVTENQERLHKLQARAKEIFSEADKNKDGSLSHTELKRVLQENDDLRSVRARVHKQEKEGLDHY